MKVEVHDASDPETVLATVAWTAGRVSVQAEDPAIAERLRDVFRPTAVVVEDASYRRLGTHGEVVLQPGDLEWFRAVVQRRLPQETDLVGRMVPGISKGGYDPAAGYRTFESTVERLLSG
jgi:hypothetical protein